MGIEGAEDKDERSDEVELGAVAIVVFVELSGSLLVET